MAIPFQCPHCDALTDVFDQFAGQTGPCAVCGREITVPDLAADATARGYQNRLRGRGGVTVLNLLMMIGAGMFGCGGVAALFVVVLAGIFVTLPLVWSASTGVTDPALVGVAGNSSGLTACQSNLRRIGAAMQRYHDMHGAFPHATQMGEDGKPAHSWRVLLLPFLGEDELFEQYDLNQPWDSEHNQRLAAKMPKVYACPDDTGNDPQRETSYMVIVSSDGIFASDTSAALYKVQDPSRTLLVVEVASSGISWLEPVDLQGSRMHMDVNGVNDGGIGSRHREGGASMLMADGSVEFMPEYQGQADHLRMLLQRKKETE